ncbi:MAG: NAD-dependent epimerase/dehydratase family protein [Myxococcales bacterium]|nr:MAG: NAD-dependent epimerase/dehydratase family protein [Myxococcales bacterium]
MKILVTGVTGFTGGHVGRALAKRGHAVRALVRREEDAARVREAGIEVALGDLRDAGAVERAVEGVELVYHIAAAFRVAGQPDGFYRDVNVGGTRNVLNAARKHTVRRVVYCSTVGVHGEVGREPVDESAPFNPGDIYQRTKVEAEQLAAAAFAHDLPGVIFRPGGIYGPGDTRFLKLFRAVYRGRFVMLGSGEVHYQLVYIDDLVEGILLCGQRDNAPGNVYILTGEPVITLNQFVRYVADAVGVKPPRWRVPLWPVKVAAHACEWVCRPLRIPPPIYPRRVDFFCKERAFKIDKARRELGFEPKVAPAEGLRRTAEWYFERGHLESQKAKGERRKERDEGTEGRRDAGEEERHEGTKG